MTQRDEIVRKISELEKAMTETTYGCGEWQDMRYDIRMLYFKLNRL